MMLRPVASGKKFSRREANKAEVRRRLLQAARELFAQRGIVRTTMDDIARRAEVSRATVFNYFPAKSDIVAELVARLEGAFRRAVDEQLALPRSTAERIRGVFDVTAAGMLRAPALHRLLIGESEAHFTMARVSGRRMGRMYGAFSDLLEAGRAKHEVRTDVSVETLAQIVGGTYMAILHGWRLSQRYPLACRLEEAAHVLGEVIAPRPEALRLVLEETEA